MIENVYINESINGCENRNLKTTKQFNIDINL